MKYTIADNLNKILKDKKILINLVNKHEQSAYSFVELLFLDEMAMDSISKSFSNCFSRKMQKEPTLINLRERYEQLILLERGALSGELQTPQALKKAKACYQEVLAEISQNNIAQMITDPQTKQPIFLSFNVKNLDKLSTLFNQALSTIKPNQRRNQYMLMERILNNKSVELIFNGSDKFGFNAYMDNANAIRDEKDLEILLDSICEDVESLDKTIKIFKDFQNCYLLIDGIVVDYKYFNQEMMQALSMSTFNNSIIQLKEISEMAQNYIFDSAGDFVFMDEILLKNMQQIETQTKDESKSDAIQTGIGQTVKKIEAISAARRIEEGFKNIIGLDEVKEQITDMINFCNKLKSVGKFSMKNSHMCFVGNPGTGKTTVARIVADVLYQEGYLKNNKLKEVGAVELRGEYMGQTGPRVQKVIQESEGGVLLIDEAYQLCDTSRSDDMYGKEALATIIKAMEDNDNLMVIFAGYEEETMKMIQYNQGLDSRIGSKIRFSNYSQEQLLEIAKLVAKKNNYELSDDALIVIKQEIDKQIKDKNFSNGRFVRNLITKCERIQTRRAKMDDFTIVAEDVEKALEIERKNMPKNDKKTIGFSI